MSKLISIDKALNREIKNSLTSYSNRILNGGMYITPATSNRWLSSVQALETSNICIGTSVTEEFEYLTCSLFTATK